MIDFVYNLNEVLPVWPNEKRWSLHQIADATKTSLPHVLQYLSEGLGKEIDVAESISHDEASEAIHLLSRRIRPQIEEREKERAERRQQSEEALGRLMGRVVLMQKAGKWHGTFRTLGYFAGQHEEDLSETAFIGLCSEILRSGIRSRANVQELAQWLQRAVGAALNLQSGRGIEEALDLLDAYGEYFLCEESGKGALVMRHVLAVLEEPAARFEQWESYKQLVEQLYPAD